MKYTAVLLCSNMNWDSAMRSKQQLYARAAESVADGCSQTVCTKPTYGNITEGQSFRQGSSETCGKK